MRLPLLRLCAIVPFPQTPLYFVSVPDPSVTIPERVALAWGGALDTRACNPQAAGVVARVVSLDEGILCCEAEERCLLTACSASCTGLPLADVEPLDDTAIPSESETCAALARELSAVIKEMAALNADLQEWPVADDSPSGLSLSLAGLVERDLESQQRWLEGRSTMQRLRDLRACIQPTLAFYATQASLTRLGAQLQRETRLGAIHQFRSATTRLFWFL
ncbi:hypothetical protein AB1Y20_003964 [Prymnesium parvum]|uniref:Uncharacterized protein n=1 Tax=Prymnesium parvum TaxID=97485 RepID=A0AB34J639_PRYPA